MVLLLAILSVYTTLLSISAAKFNFKGEVQASGNEYLNSLRSSGHGNINNQRVKEERYLRQTNYEKGTSYIVSFRGYLFANTT